MHINLNTNNIMYKSNNSTQKTNNSTLLAISTCAMLTPFISFIDGESLKKTYKNRYIARYATGLVAIGGGISTINLLADKYISQTKNKSEKNLIKNIGIGTLSLSALTLVEYWSQKNKKEFNKKYLILAPILGAAIGIGNYFINKKGHQS